MEELIEHIKQVFPYDSINMCPDKYMETVMDYVYSEIKDELVN